MSRVGNTKNLEKNSRYDLLIYDFPEGFPVGKINLGFGKTPKKISGIEKVSQVFIKCLLTYQKTDVLYSSAGTEFPAFAGTYNLQSTDLSGIRGDIINAISAAEAQAKSILNVNSEGATSQLDSVKVVSVNQLGDGVTINVQLITKAGESAPIALPFTSDGIEVNA